MDSQAFFNFSPHQHVNQWLGIALISLMCFFVVLFYFIHRTEAFGAYYSSTTEYNMKTYVR